MRTMTVNAAKDYLVARIAEQAEGEGAPLAPLERKMLYFTEEGGLTASMQAVSDEFDRRYDQDEYELRIGGLVARYLASDRSDEDVQAWADADEALSGGDHYILVLITAGSQPDAGRFGIAETPLRSGLEPPDEAVLVSQSRGRAPGLTYGRILTIFAICVAAAVVLIAVLVRR